VWYIFWWATGGDMSYYDIFRVGCAIFVITSIFNELYALYVFAGTILLILLLFTGEIGWAKYQEEKEFRKREREIAVKKPVAAQPEPEFDRESHEEKVRERVSKRVCMDLFGVGLLIAALLTPVFTYAIYLSIVLVIIQFFERLNREGEFHFRKGRW